jgi:hypothetical protein
MKWNRGAAGRPQQAHEIYRREPGFGTRQYDVDDMQHNGGRGRAAAGCGRGKAGDKFGRGFAEIVVGRQRVAQRGRAAMGHRHGFLAVAAERGQQLGDEFGAILWKHAECIAGFVNEAGAFERELDVAHFLGRAGGIEHVRAKQRGRKGIFSGLTRRRRRNLRFQIRNFRWSFSGSGGLGRA